MVAHIRHEVSSLLYFLEGSGCNQKPLSNECLRAEQMKRAADEGSKPDGLTGERRSDEVSFLDALSVASTDVLHEAVALGERAALVGFDWPSARDALEKVREEVEEVEELLQLDAHQAGARETQALLEGELGDLLFAVCMVARLTGVEPVVALARTHAKFRQRFLVIERALAERGQSLEDASLEEMEEIWQAAKREAKP